MKKYPQFQFSLLSTLLLLQSITAVEFTFNGFDFTNISLFGNATINSRVLTLTNHSSFSIGRALFPSKITVKFPNTSNVIPFSTSFIFSIAPYKDVNPGHGVVFLFVPFTGIHGASSAQNLGFLNLTNNGNPKNHILGIEFDVFQNAEFNDIDANHVGIDVNSLSSLSAHTAGYWPNGQASTTTTNTSGDMDGKLFKKLVLNNGKNYQVWIDYADFQLNVTMAIAGTKRPKRPLLSVKNLNLSDVFEEEMYVGFTAATGRLVESHKILAWSFSTSNFSIGDSLVTNGLPSFVLPKVSFFRSKAFIVGVSVGVSLGVCFCGLIGVLLVKTRRRRARRRGEMEGWELEYWPHRINYEEIEASTKGFAEENVIGIGGNGNVYKGVLVGGVAIAVKRISHENDDAMREFLAEISSLGRLKHRNLVGLRGWCKRDKGNFMLIYDYMENGSLDKRVFECEEGRVLSCEDRIRVLKEVALGVLYLHEGWESKVLHRDIKASNVLLDHEMKARLGDFGLARMHDHTQVATTTRVVGTLGYLAPELITTGRASARSDVYGLGVLILEVMCGRRPIEGRKPPLVEWVWELMVCGELLNALDPRLKSKGPIDETVVERVLHLGLLCAYPDPEARPTMRQVVKVFDCKYEEGDEEDIETYLLEQIKSQKMYPSYKHKNSHPTFRDLQDSITSSMSLTWSDISLNGR